jgi:hypothetical protein
MAEPPAPAAKDPKDKAASNPFLSPLDEMNQQPAEAEKSKAPAKKSVKVAKNKAN